MMKKRVMFNSHEDALLASSRIHAKSSVAEVAHVLRYLGNGTLHDRLFQPGQLIPVFTWMQQGLPFSSIAITIRRLAHLRDWPMNHVKSWRLFEPQLDEVRKELGLQLVIGKNTCARDRNPNGRKRRLPVPSSRPPSA